MNNRIRKVINNPYKIYSWIVRNVPTIGHCLSDKNYLSIVYRGVFGQKLNFKDPKTFSEKVQWLKIYDRKPIYTTMVDKIEAKKYVSSLIGEEYVIPTLGVWNTFDEINFDLLPEQFVLKCSHDSGGLVICKDKSSFDLQAAKKKIEKCLRKNFYWEGREWPYKNVLPRILAEPYMEDERTHELRDYKFFVFNGVAKALFIATDRGSKEETKFDFFDIDFNHLPFTNGHPNADSLPEKPKSFEKMKALSSVLAQNIPLLRVDFYEVNGKTYFGELTFSHWSGLTPFEPQCWDKKFGNWIDLPIIKEKK